MSVRQTTGAVHRFVPIQPPHFSAAADRVIDWVQMTGIVMVSMHVMAISDVCIVLIELMSPFH